MSRKINFKILFTKIYSRNQSCFWERFVATDAFQERIERDKIRLILKSREQK